MSESGIKQFRRKLEQRRAERTNNLESNSTATFEFESQGHL